MSETQSAQLWPPPYQVRLSKKAKRIQLSISERKGLEVVIPYARKRYNPETILEEHKTWVLKQLAKLRFDPNAQKVYLPSEIALRSIDQQWRVEYDTSIKQLKLYARPDQSLVITGQEIPVESTLDLIIKWLRKQAKLTLATKLKQVSKDCNLPYTSLSVRAQETRWGSCNSKKQINLNYKLIFLPDNLVRYTMIHELCHTKHLNHGQGFWQLCQQHDSLSRLHDKLLNSAQSYIPRWLA